MRRLTIAIVVGFASLSAARRYTTPSGSVTRSNADDLQRVIELVVSGRP